MTQTEVDCSGYSDEDRVFGGGEGDADGIDGGVDGYEDVSTARAKIVKENRD